MDVRGAKGPYPPRLVDLQADPAERKDLAAEQPAEVQRLLEAWRAWSSAMPVRAMEHSARDVDQERLFRQLGYTGEERPPK